MKTRQGAAGRSAGWGRRALVVLLVVGLLGLAAIGSAVRESPSALAAEVARDGLTAETAAPSCWSVKQSYPSSADGVYWLVTPKLIEPQQFYCDQTTDGGGWVLVGRGREGWSFQYWGQGSPSTVRSPVTGAAAFAPATLSTPTIDGLMNGGRMDALTDGIRLRRATNTTGTTWQEARMRVKTYGKWSWAFGGGIYLSSIRFDGTTTNLSTSSYRTNTTANVQVANDTRRVFTYPWANHNLRAGFSFGSSVTTGTSSASSYLWEFANENSAIPFTQVFIRPQISEADIIAAGVSHAPNSGVPASTVKAMLDHRPTPQPWGVTGLNLGTSIDDLNANVTAFADIGNTIYIGGKFLQVQRGPTGPTFTQSYLAAFDKTTGEWISTFDPVLDAPVWEIKAAPDGTKLFVGGEFTSVNAVANTTGLAALDPATGAPVPSWLGYVSRTTGPADVRTLDVQSGFLYVGGQFNRVTGGTGTQLLGPIVVGRLARLRLSDGRPDGAWKPNVETAPQDIDASPQGDRVYVVGLFQTLNEQPLNPPKLAVVDATTGAAVPGLQPWRPNASSSEWTNVILEVGDKVYQGGTQHILHQYARSDYAFERSHMTKTGGDFQGIAFRDGIVYAACHCNDWQYQDANTWSDPIGYSQVNPINMIGAYDTTNDFEVLPEFHTTQLDLTGSQGEGPWELFVDSNNCLWAGGDLVRLGTTPSPFYGGYERFCSRDATAPTTPPNSRATLVGNDVNLTWNASTDNVATTPVRYEILKDDPTFGTIVMGSTFERSFTDTNVVGPTRYFVRAVDADGNRSATTSVLSVTAPPAAAATLLAHGATWSYRSDGVDLGSSWHQPTFNSASWATDAAQLGWGGKGEATLIPRAPVTSYFVKHLSLANPNQHETVTIRLKRDDGALVYVNGVPVVRDNMPTGTVTATTVASSFTSGTSESTWFEHQIPASLFKAGDNTIAVEVHQAEVDNADAIFDLELVARDGTETTPPTTPNPTVGTVGDNTIALSWTPSSDNTAVIGYLVRRNGTPVAFTTGTSFTDSGLSPFTGYSYQVVAIDTSGNASTPGTVTASTVDTVAPTLAMTFPANNARYNSAGWNAGCTATTDLCGTAADVGSGVASVRLTIRRSNNNQYWTGAAWQAAPATLIATGTTAWSATLPSTKLANGVTYTVTAWSVDRAGGTSPNTVRTFTYDTVRPATTAASIVTTNKSGAMNLKADTFAVTFNEPLKPSTVPGTGTLTLSRSNGNTSYGITGLTNGLRTTGSTGYLGSSATTRTVTFAGTLVLSNSNRTVTFKVTGACAGSCTARVATPRSGAFQFVPATTLRDVAGNAPATTVITASSQVLF